MGKKILTNTSISNKDFTVSLGKIRIKDSSVYIKAINEFGDLLMFDLGDPLHGWVKPTNMKDMGTTMVQFSTGIASFKYVNNAWFFIFFQSNSSNAVIVSNDINNSITTGLDGGAYFDASSIISPGGPGIPSITDTIIGRVIGNFNNGTGGITPIRETVTTISTVGQDVTYTNENGSTLSFKQAIAYNTGEVRNTSNSDTALIINDNAITQAKMADNSIGTAELINNAITQAKMAANSIGTTELINNSVTQAKIAANSIGTTSLIDNSVTFGKLSISGAVTNDFLRYLPGGWVLSQTTPITGIDTTSIDFTVSGSEGHSITAVVKKSADTDNILTLESNGVKSKIVSGGSLSGDGNLATPIKTLTGKPAIYIKTGVHEPGELGLTQDVSLLFSESCKAGTTASYGVVTYPDAVFQNVSLVGTALTYDIKTGAPRGGTHWIEISRDCDNFALSRVGVTISEPNNTVYWDDTLADVFLGTVGFTHTAPITGKYLVQGYVNLFSSGINRDVVSKVIVNFVDKATVTKTIVANTKDVFPIRAVVDAIAGQSLEVEYRCIAGSPVTLYAGALATFQLINAEET